MIIEGTISVKAAIANHKRTVEEVFMDAYKRTKDFAYIRKLAVKEGIPVRDMKRKELDELFTGRSHGGVGAAVSERMYDAFQEGDVFFLDGIEDPFNLGYSLRTLMAFGVKNVLIAKRDLSGMEGQLLKSSAGAFDMLNVVMSDDPGRQIDGLKNEGYAVYGLYRGEDSYDIFEETFPQKAVFLLGGEKRGISADLLKLCDRTLFIPYGSPFRNALNACAALDVVATLLFRQRKKNDQFTG